MMHDDGKSDRPVVPVKSPKMSYWEFYQRHVEVMKGRGLAKENADPAQQDDWTQSHLREEPGSDPEALPNALDRIRQAARRDKKLRFTNLWHHVYDVARLRQAYFELSKRAAPGVDGQTWQAYGENLEANLRDLSERLRRGTYKARPVKRAYVPKADGRQRPIGIPVLEDKIVQRATVEVLNAVYEADFKGFSYGFRPSRGAHQALDALAVAIQSRKVNWVLDADISSFFDTLDHQWLLKFVEHRIADPQVLRHIRKWLKAGVMEQGRRLVQEEGTPQGGSISPLLANIYLHYTLDLWADHWRKRPACGDVVIVRYADDFVVGFEREADARRFLEELRERFGRFNLELHAAKTRIIEFGAACDGRYRKGVGDKPATFHFLGFTHSCGRTRWGRFIVLRRTMGRRMRAKLRALKEELRRRVHESISTTGAWLRGVLSGYFRYFGVPRNSQPLWAFRAMVVRLWHGVLNRRSQRRTTTWARMGRIARRWLPYPRICQPYPEERLCVSI
ncbi:MAG: group II intron reverse transcriptase/maturase [Phycisphaerae bacterium]|nr:group II intron reverse transcriptase/maturase [Phycisphaerae bacterium]